MISKYINEYVEKYKENPERIEKFSEFIEKFFSNLEPEDIDIKNEFSDDLEEFLLDITPENMKEVILHLKHRDCSLSGEKWTHNEIKQLSEQYNAKEKIIGYNVDYCEEYFWFARNYVYATHYNPSRTVAGYIELAIDEYCNKNMSMKKYIAEEIKKLEHDVN